MIDFGSLEEFLPPFPTVWIEEVDPGATSSPAPAFELAFPTLRFDEYLAFGSFLINRIVCGAFQVGIDDHHHLCYGKASGCETKA